MGSLIKWDLKQTICSKAFFGVGLAVFAGVFISLLYAVRVHEKTVYDIFLGVFNDLNSMSMLLIGVFVGIAVARAFEDRKFQAAVMAGYSRFQVLFSKLFSVCTAVILLSIFSSTVCAVTLFSVCGTSGIEGSFFLEVIMRMIVYALVSASSSAVCFLLSVLVRNLGGAIALNTIAMFVAHLATEILLSKEWAFDYLKYTAFGQNYIVIFDASISNLLIAAAVSAAGLGIILMSSYAMLKRAELK